MNWAPCLALLHIQRAKMEKEGVGTAIDKDVIRE